ncbi:MAG: PilZ domain-containing protein [Magnetococcales bacterium]|nr:PilZ domain-containing protein [Magnetococcales bacterium]
MVIFLETDIQRRAYARVEDLLPISWERVEPDEQALVAACFAKHRYFPPQPGDDVRKLLTTLTSSHEMAQLRQRQPDLAHTLEQLDAKLNLVLRLLHPGLVEHTLAPARVTLGGDGISFWAQDPPVQVGDFLKMQVTLAVDALTTISFFARILRMEKPDDAGLVQVACLFDPILDDHREQVVQHVFKRQTDLLRVQRGM